MASKRVPPLHMFQQGSPKRTKTQHQGTSHQKYALTDDGAYPTPAYNQPNQQNTAYNNHGNQRIYSGNVGHSGEYNYSKTNNNNNLQYNNNNGYNNPQEFNNFNRAGNRNVEQFRNENEFCRNSSPPQYRSSYHGSPGTNRFENPGTHNSENPGMHSVGNPGSHGNVGTHIPGHIGGHNFGNSGNSGHHNPANSGHTGHHNPGHSGHHNPPNPGAHNNYGPMRCEPRYEGVSDQQNVYRTPPVHREQFRDQQYPGGQYHSAHHSAQHGAQHTAQHGAQHTAQNSAQHTVDPSSSNVYYGNERDAQLQAKGTQLTEPYNNFGYNKRPYPLPHTYPAPQYKLETAVRTKPTAVKNDQDKKPETGKRKKPTSGGIRVITCNISAMLHWARLEQTSRFIFELYACLDQVDQLNDISCKLKLRDSENHDLECYYYTSSTLPDLVPAKYYRVLGKVLGNGKFTCFKIKEVAYMETKAAASLIKQSEIAMSKLILQINEH